MGYQKSKSYSVLTTLISITLSACGGEITSQGAEELKALWVVDANRQLQQVRVIARTVEKDDRRTQSVSLFTPSYSSTFTLNAESVNDELFDQYFDVSDFIRLTGKDVMRVVTATGNHQLYRRAKPLEYQTSFPFDENSPDYELRLDYSSMRYPASVASVRVFAVSNLNIAEAGSTIARDGVINVSWNIGDLMTTNGERFTQTMDIDLLSCTSENIVPATTSVTIPANIRSTTLLTGQLPNPMNTNGSAPAAQGECTYGLQLQAHLAPEQDSSTAVRIDVEYCLLYSFAACVQYGVCAGNRVIVSLPCESIAGLV